MSPFSPGPHRSWEDGEDHATATLRELSEELGIDEKVVGLGGAARGAQQGPPRWRP
ncbi:NUDIX hydrolase [Streptomyces sp. NPDC052012]|uniref:NUDIX hydrolase n=1 Tax=Streptomyces sp. NPDC052012 TaxID=3155051 RepID=UPI00345026DB